MRPAEMTHTTERRLMRLLHGELPPEEARALEQRMAGDAELRAAYERLAAAWERVQAPPEGRLPADFAAGVVAAARRIRDGELSWSLAPVWARAGAALALAAGLVLGAAFDGGFAPPPAPVGGDVQVADVYDESADADADAVPLTLSEIYWLALEESGGRLSDDAESPGEASAP